MRFRLSAAGVAVVLLGAVLTGPAAALAASTVNPAAPGQGPGNPLTPGLPQSQVTTPTQTATVNPASTSGSSSGGSVSGTGVVAIAIGAIVVLGGISLFIWRDARRRAPVRQHAPATAGVGARTATKPKPKPRKPSPAERRRRKRGRAR
jgi:hypothetical protein